MCSFRSNTQFENERENRWFAYYYYNIKTKGMENFTKKWIFSQKVFILSSDSFDKRERLNELNTNTDNTEREEEWISSRTRCNKKSGKASTP